MNKNAVRHIKYISKLLTSMHYNDMSQFFVCMSMKDDSMCEIVSLNLICLTIYMYNKSKIVACKKIEIVFQILNNHFNVLCDQI